ncbi:MAG: adenylate/guanylate cyclase domain-containing protein [Alphaproteobacteria bacterium]|nr:MAG: adenylate/guanylate cyclase domain-containing protein [Alphaproteobacteria bacterium]
MTDASALPEPSARRVAALDPRAVVRSLRLASGLVLFTFVFTHLLNHTLGILGLAAMEWGQALFGWLWWRDTSAFVLASAAAVHVSLALWSIYRRRSLVMSPWEAAQLGFGLLIPPLVTAHVIETKIAYDLYGADGTYRVVIFHLDQSVLRHNLQKLLLLIAWIHGCIGLHYWLRLREWYRPITRYLFAFAVLLPGLALAGFIAASQEVSALALDPAFVERARQAVAPPTPELAARLAAIRDYTFLSLAGLLAFTLAARQGRAALEARKARVQVVYPTTRVRVVPGMTVLEASRSAGIPHASVCGGRGRCSTCRIRLGAGYHHAPPPTADEAKVLQRVAAGPNVRLACQLRPTHDLEVVPILPPDIQAADIRKVKDYAQGRDLDIVVMFADLRGFTSLSEHKLPYDLVFLLNRYFAEMGQAIETAGGRIDKFIGDGIMALFGVDDGPEAGAKSALTAAAAMADRLERLNTELAATLDAPLKIGIGLHAGHAIVGEMGWGRAVSLTAIGDMVNTASRLESLTKDLGAQLVFSEDVARFAGLDLDQFAQEEVVIRGRQTSLRVAKVVDARTLKA